MSGSQENRYRDKRWKARPFLRQGFFIFSALLIGDRKREPVLVYFYHDNENYFQNKHPGYIEQFRVKYAGRQKV